MLRPGGESSLSEFQKSGLKKLTESENRHMFCGRSAPRSQPGQLKF
jgi:hypothetical protein